MFVAISSLDVPEDRQADLEAAFEARSRLVDEHDGFRRLRLLRAKGQGEYLLVLEWEHQADFKAYVRHPDFDHAHGDLDEAITPGPLRQFDVVLDSEEGG